MSFWLWVFSFRSCEIEKEEESKETCTSCIKEKNVCNQGYSRKTAKPRVRNHPFFPWDSQIRRYVFKKKKILFFSNPFVVLLLRLKKLVLRNSTSVLIPIWSILKKMMLSQTRRKLISMKLSWRKLWTFRMCPTPRHPCQILMLDLGRVPSQRMQPVNQQLLQSLDLHPHSQPRFLTLEADVCVWISQHILLRTDFK